MMLPKSAWSSLAIVMAISAVVLMFAGDGLALAAVIMFAVAFTKATAS